MRKSLDQVRAEIAEERERIRAKVLPEVDAYWKEMEERHALDAAEQRAIVEVGRERRARREAQEVAPTSALSPEEDETMATTGTEMIATAVNGGTPFSKEQQLRRAQPGQKKPGAASRIRAEVKAVTDRKQASKKNPQAAAVKKLGAAIKEAGNGTAQKSKYDAEAKKKGVEVKVWNKGSLADPKHIEVIYYLRLSGSRSWAVPDRFTTAAAARKFAQAAGYPIKEEGKK